MCLVLSSAVSHTVRTLSQYWKSLSQSVQSRTAWVSSSDRLLPLRCDDMVLWPGWRSREVPGDSKTQRETAQMVRRTMEIMLGNSTEVRCT